MSRTTHRGGFDAQDFMRRYYANIWAVANGGVDSLREWETEDIEYELPWSERLKAFKGIDQHAKLLGFFTASLTSYDMRMTGFHPGADPDRFVVECSGSGHTVQGTEYRNDYVQFITIKGGRIARVREYFNPLAVRDLAG